MSEDAGAMLLAAIEALQADVRANTAELQGMREEARAERKASNELETLRKAAREKKARQRASRDSPGTEPIKQEDPKPTVPEQVVPGQVDVCPGTVPGTAQVVKALVVDLDLKTTRTRKNLQRPGTVPGTSASPGDSEERPTVATRKAYGAAYLQRWGVEPIIGSKSNGMLMHFVNLVGREAAPEIATFYLSHNWSLYVNAKHPIDLLLRDAPKLHTEWKTNSPSTYGEAQQQERTSDNLRGWEKLKRQGAGP